MSGKTIAMDRHTRLSFIFLTEHFLGALNFDHPFHIIQMQGPGRATAPTSTHAMSHEQTRRSD